MLLSLIWTRFKSIFKFHINNDKVAVEFCTELCFERSKVTFSVVPKRPQFEPNFLPQKYI